MLIESGSVQLPSLASSLSLNVPTPTSDTERLPELRHNLRLIAEGTRAELQALAKEGKAVQEKRQWLSGQERKASSAVHEESRRKCPSRPSFDDRPGQCLYRHRTFTRDHEAGCRDRVNHQERNKPCWPLQGSRVAIRSAAVQLCGRRVCRIRFGSAYCRFHCTHSKLLTANSSTRLINGQMRTAWSEWEPLQQPELYLKELKRWKKAFRLENTSAGSGAMEVDLFENSKAFGKRRTPEMTAFEALIWNYWLPRVRSAIKSVHMLPCEISKTNNLLSNVWQPSDPQPAMRLYASWSPLLPAFIRDNILDQLILPKVKSAMAEWSPRSSTHSLHGLVFPWLQYAGLRMDEILEEAKRRLKSWLKSWKAKDGIPTGFGIWKEVRCLRIQ